VAFRHLVLFRIHDDVSEDRVSQALERLRSLADLPGVTALAVARSLDERKGRILVEDATFSDAASFAAFRALPAHLLVGTEMATISDWWIGDYEDGAR
jgi:hypothetical protein